MDMVRCGCVTVTIDFSRRMRSACCISRVDDEGRRLRLYGWNHTGDPIADGVYVILSHGDAPEETTRYVLERVRRTYDDTRMWFADAVFAPRA